MNVMNAISTSIPVIQPYEPLISHGTQLAAKVKDFVFPYFKGSAGIFYWGVGFLELGMTKKSQTDEELLIRMRQCCKTALPSSKEYLLSHGGLLIGTGLCSIFEALHAFGAANLEHSVPYLYQAGQGFFTFANLLALEENIRIYQEAGNIGSDHSEHEIKHAAWLRQSAVFGILSNLGYLTAITMTLFGASTAMALLLGVLSACFGGLKILSDFVSV